jgi:hypothetical protein
MKKITVTSDNEKIMAICGELQFIHKFGTHEVEIYKSGKMFGLMFVPNVVNPVILTNIIKQVIENIGKIQEMKERSENTQIEYEKRAMVMN